MLKEFKNKSIITKIFIILIPILIIAIICVGVILIQEDKKEKAKEEKDNVQLGQDDNETDNFKYNEKNDIIEDNIENVEQDDLEKEYGIMDQQQISRQDFLKSLTKNDVQTFRSLVFFKTGFTDEENFVNDRFDIIGSDIIYTYNYAFMRKANGYNVGTELRCMMTQLTPTKTIPENWREMRTMDLQYNFIVKEINDKPTSINFSVATGVTDSEEAEVIAQMQTKIDEKLQKFKDESLQKAFKVDLDKIGKKYFEYAIKYNYEISKNVKGFSQIESSDENLKKKYSSLKDELLNQNKSLCIRYYRKTNTSNNYKISSYNEYFAVAILIDIGANELPLNHNKFEIDELISLGCINDLSHENTFITEITTGNSDDEKSIIEQQYKLICSYFGI